MKGDIADLKTIVTKIAEAVTKLAVLEDRQSTQNGSIQKLLDRFDTLEEKQHGVELRLATAMLNHERLMRIESELAATKTLIAGYEGSAKGVGSTAKVVWAVLGTTVAGAVAWLFGRGGV